MRGTDRHRSPAHGDSCVIRYAVARSDTPGPAWGTGGRGFESRRPDQFRARRRQIALPSSWPRPCPGVSDVAADPPGSVQGGEALVGGGSEVGDPGRDRRKMPGWVELDDGVLVGIDPVLRIRERHAEQAGAIGRPDQEVRTQRGPGTGRAFEPSASVTRKNALLLDGSRFRTYARRVPSGDQPRRSPPRGCSRRCGGSSRRRRRRTRRAGRPHQAPGTRAADRPPTMWAHPPMSGSTSWARSCPLPMGPRCSAPPRGRSIRRHR